MFQTGYYALGIHETPYYMRGVVAPAPVHPPGMGRRLQIIREDEEILTIIIAFLHMKGR